MSGWYLEAAEVTFTPDAVAGGFLDDPIKTWRTLRLAALGQRVLCTPRGLAKIWGVEPRIVGKIAPTLKPTVSFEGSGWVREAIVSDDICRSSIERGCTPDLEFVVEMDLKLPDGPVSMWRGRGLPQNVRRAVFERDGRVCAYCGETGGKFHIDHVLPVASGGTDDLENLAVSCQRCNLAKSAMTVEEFKKKMEASQ